MSDLNLGTLYHVLVLWYGVGHNYGFKVAPIESGEGLSTEDTVSQDGVDLKTLLLIILLTTFWNLTLVAPSSTSF